MKHLLGLLVAAMLAPLVASPLHPTQPPFDDPEVGGECAEYEWQYDTGAEMILPTPLEDYDEGGEWVPYLFFNGPSGYTPDPANCNSAAQGSLYASAGELGATVNVSMYTQPFSELPANSRGFVIWAADYTTDPFWEWPWGWSAIDTETIYASWEFTSNERLFVGNEHIGWQRFYQNPSSAPVPRVFALGVITGSGGIQGEEGEKFSETWMVTFTDILP